MTELCYRDDSYMRDCRATVISADDRGIVLDRTVFYAAGGGQPGDTGELVLDSGAKIAVVDAVRGESGEVLHIPAPSSALPAPGEAVRLQIDWERRYAHMRLHTCLHLLSSVVVAPVTGGKIKADKAHLDFDIDMALLDKARIEERLNELIQAGHTVQTGWITDDELDANPQLVKTMSVAPPRGQGRVRIISIPGVDVQPCGGTHVANTAEIGRVAVLKIRSEGKRNKRVTISFQGQAG